MKPTSDDIIGFFSVLVIILIPLVVISVFIMSLNAQHNRLYEEYRWREYTKSNGQIVKYFGKYAVRSKNLDLIELESKKYILVDDDNGNVLHVWTCYDEVDPSKLNGEANKIVWYWMRTDEFQRHLKQRAQKVR